MEARVGGKIEQQLILSQQFKVNQV